MIVTQKNIFLLLLLITTNLFSLEIDSTSSNLNILNHAYTYLDCNQTLSYENLENTKFNKSTQSSLALGIVPECSLWIKFTLHNSSNTKLHKILEYVNPETEDLYFYDGNRTILDGMFHHHRDRFSINPIFNITLDENETKTYYIKAHSKISTLIAQLKLWSKDDFLNYEYIHKTYLFIFFAVIAILLIYNMMLLIFTKDIAYFYYIFYLFSMMVFESIYLGIAQLYLFSNETSVFITKATIGYISLLVIPMILFIMKFLHTYKFPKIDKILKLYLYLLPLLSILSFDNFLFDLNIMIVFFPLAFVMIYTGFYALKNGIQEALYYLIGWGFVITSMTLAVIKSLGIYDITTTMPYINELSFVLEALLFSIALAHRIKLLSEAKHRANQKLIELQQKEQEKLEEIVSQRTKELVSSIEEKELLYSELSHRVKNNLQMILSLITLQIHASSSQDTKNQLTITKNRINSISKLYEILYLKTKLNELDTLEYFKYIVSTIQENFDKNVTVKYDIKHNISVENLIYCGLILNELVTNSFKYAFKESGTIEIEIYKEHDIVHMNVKDNGKGFEDSKPNSLGLNIVKTLVKKQLLGEISIDSTNGTCTMTNWRE